MFNFLFLTISFCKLHSNLNGCYGGCQCSWTIISAETMQVSIIQSSSLLGILLSLISFILISSLAACMSVAVTINNSFTVNVNVGMFLNRPLPASFFFVFVFSTVNSSHVHLKISPMMEFEPHISAIRSNRSTNRANNITPKRRYV